MTSMTMWRRRDQVAAAPNITIHISRPAPISSDQGTEKRNASRPSTDQKITITRIAIITMATASRARVRRASKRSNIIRCPMMEEGGRCAPPFQEWLLTLGRGDSGLDVVSNSVGLFCEDLLNRRGGLLAEGRLVDVDEGHALLDQRLAVEIVLLLLDLIAMLTCLLDGLTQHLLIGFIKAIP